jgi:hypothetical protein
MNSPNLFCENHCPLGFGKLYSEYGPRAALEEVNAANAVAIVKVLMGLALAHSTASDNNGRV